MKENYYSELLAHPEWQKVRYQVMQRANFKCEYQNCELTLDEKNPLNVHHTYYKKGLKPWDYPLDSLECLCYTHHSAKHDIDVNLDYRIYAKLSKYPEQFVSDTVYKWSMRVLINWIKINSIQGGSYNKKMVDMHYSRIRSLEPFYGLENLVELDLRNCKFHDWERWKEQVVDLKKQLPRCKIYS